MKMLRDGCIGIMLGFMWITGMSADELNLDGRWRLLNAGSGAAPIRADDANAPVFTVNGRTILGFDGCNRFFASLIKPGVVRKSRKRCSGETLMLPLDFDDVNAHLQSGRIEGDILTLPERGIHPPSTYKRILVTKTGGSGDTGAQVRVLQGQGLVSLQGVEGAICNGQH